MTLNGVAALAGFIAGIREKQLVAFALMVSELGQSPHQWAFAE